MIDTGADFSPCRRYRYRLWRRWDLGPAVVWIMLNPSTADEYTNDPTIRRCIAFARAWGYAGVEVCNLFAWRATSPRDLFRAAAPVGPANDRIILDTVVRAACIVLAWGVHGRHRGRAEALLASLAGRGIALRCLGTTRDGQPKHPLYLPGDAKTMPFRDSLPNQRVEHCSYRHPVGTLS